MIDHDIEEAIKCPWSVTSHAKSFNFLVCLNHTLSSQISGVASRVKSQHGWETVITIIQSRKCTFFYDFFFLFLGSFQFAVDGKLLHITRFFQKLPLVVDLNNSHSEKFRKIIRVIVISRMIFLGWRTATLLKKTSAMAIFLRFFRKVLNVTAIPLDDYFQSLLK